MGAPPSSFDWIWQQRGLSHLFPLYLGCNRARELDVIRGCVHVDTIPSQGRIYSTSTFVSLGLRSAERPRAAQQLLSFLIRHGSSTSYLPASKFTCVTH